MDSSAQNKTTKEANLVAQPAQQIQQSQLNQSSPSASSFNKEIGVSSFSENIKPSEEEIKVEEDLQNVGIAFVNNDKPKLDEVHEEIGVKASAESAPVKTEPSGKVSLPMSEQEAEDVLKTKSSKFNLHENVGAFAGEYSEDAKPFLAALVIKVFKEMHRRVFRKK